MVEDVEQPRTWLIKKNVENMKKKISDVGLSSSKQ